MTKFKIDKLREIRSTLSYLVDKLDYLMADMECKSQLAIETDHHGIDFPLTYIEEFIASGDHHINGAERAKQEAELSKIRRYHQELRDKKVKAK